MTELKQDEDLGWEPCPAGALASSTITDSAGQLRRTFLINVALGVFLGGAGLRAYINSRVLPPASKSEFLSCVEVKANLAGYIERTLDVGVQHKIEIHLSKCQACSLAYRQKLGEQRPNTEIGDLTNLFADNHRA